MLVVFVAFWVLFALSVVPAAARAKLREKRGADLALDLLGLLVQGALVPLLQLIVLPKILGGLFPTASRALHLPPVAAFVLNFVVVDALYYYNHRLLHGRRLWPVHAVHHTVSEMDVLGTSRNAIFTPLLIVYLWVNGVFLTILDDPTWFALSMSITAALDLWRHSRVALPAGSKLHRFVALFLITPHEHAWHHSRDAFGCNYGANLSLWDRVHGTYRSPESPPIALGIDAGDGFLRRAFFPFSTKETTSSGSSSLEPRT